MLKKLLYYFAALICFAALNVCVWLLGVSHGKKVQRADDCSMFRPDTEYVHDTAYHYRPVPIGIKTLDLIYLSDVDTVHQHDTVFYAVQREQRVYGDSTFRAVVSGYQPSLDELDIYIDSRTVRVPVPVPVPENRTLGSQSLSLSAELMYDGSLLLPITLEYGRTWRGLYFGGGIGYDPLSRSPVLKANAVCTFRW